ncbi:MAG: hypothetical protein ACK4YO_02670 [Candidatus Altarchaeaceae archaeon]
MDDRFNKVNKFNKGNFKMGKVAKIISILGMMFILILGFNGIYAQGKGVDSYGEMQKILYINIVGFINALFGFGGNFYALQGNVDMAVTDISINNTIQEGCDQRLNILVNYSNLGDVMTSGEIYLFVDGNLVDYSGYVLNSGYSSSKILQTNLLGIGNHTIRVVINATNDQNLSNNEKVINYSVLPGSPDVSVSLLSGDLSFSGACILPPPGEPCRSDWDCMQYLRINPLIINKGCGNATNVEVRYYVDDILVDNKTTDVEYGKNKTLTGIWNLQDGKIKPLKGTHEIKVEVVFNGTIKTASTTKTTCTMPNTTFITETNQTIQFGTQCKNLNISQNVPITAACNTSNISAEFSDFSFNGNIITKGNFSCINCNGLSISSGEIKNLTTNKIFKFKKFPEFFEKLLEIGLIEYTKRKLEKTNNL